MTGYENAELDRLYALTTIADHQAIKRKIASMRARYAVIWQNSYGLSEFDEFDHIKDMEEFADIVDGVAVIGGRIIA